MLYIILYVMNIMKCLICVMILYVCICLFVQFTVHDGNKIILIITKLFTNNNIISNYSTNSNISHCYDMILISIV